MINTCNTSDRAKNRLKVARIERAKPDPDKATKAQELYKRLGVGLFR